MSPFFTKLFISPTKSTLLQLFRYGFVGGIAFIVDYGALFICTEYLGIHHLVSAAIAFIFGLVVNYLLSTSWVFAQRTQKNKWVEFAIFAVIGIVGLGLNELIIYVCTDLLQVHYMLSKLISTGIVFFWNFFARKLTLFRSNQ